MTRIISLLWIIAALAGPAAAQSTPAPDNQDLVHSARFLRQKLDELLVAMTELATTLQTTEPEVATLLRQTVAYAQRKDVRYAMDEVVQALRSGLDQAARTSQSRVIADLQRMLRLLEGGVQDQTPLQQEIEKLRATRQRLERLIEQQQIEERKTRPFTADDIRRRSGELLERLGEMLRRQEQLHEQTGSLGAGDPAARQAGQAYERLAELLAQQQRLEQAAGQASPADLGVVGEAQQKLAERLAAAALRQKRPDLQKAVAAMRQAAERLAKIQPVDAQLAQQRAGEILQQARDQARQVLHDKAAHTPAGRLGKDQQQLADALKQVADTMETLCDQAGQDVDAESLQRGESAMQQAAEKLRSQQKSPAAEQQRKALAALRDALGRAQQVDEAIRQATQQTPPARPQQSIAERLKHLAETMQADETAEKLPAGQGDVTGAADSASQAAGELGDNQPGPANASQRKTLEQLRQATDALQEQVAQLERLKKARQLARLEERLARILESQQELSAQTRQTFSARRAKPPHYDRPDEQVLQAISGEEGTLAADIADIHKQLTEDGSTVVFPQMLQAVGDDLRLVETRLAKLQANPVTQRTQRRVERVLAQLIEAVRKELSEGPGRARRGGGGAGGGGGGKQPLIPPLAELRMLRLQQVWIREATGSLLEDVKGQAVSSEEARGQMRQLQNRQVELEKLTRKLAESMQQKP